MDELDISGAINLSIAVIKSACDEYILKKKAYFKNYNNKHDSEMHKDSLLNDYNKSKKFFEIDNIYFDIISVSV